MWYDYYDNLFRIGGNQPHCAGAGRDIDRGLLLRDLLRQVLILARQRRLLLVQALDFLVGRHRLSQLREVEYSHQANQQHTTNAQSNGSHAEEKRVQLSPAPGGQDRLCRCLHVFLPSVLFARAQQATALTRARASPARTLYGLRQLLCSRVGAGLAPTLVPSRCVYVLTSISAARSLALRARGLACTSLSDAV